MKILHLEDSPRDTELVHAYVAEEWPDCEIEIATERAGFLAKLKQQKQDLILCDFSLVAFSGLEAFKHARELAPDTPFIFFSGTIPEEVAVAAIRDGASDYVLKERPKRLITAIRQALAKSDESKKRLAAEKAVRRSEEHFRLLVDQASDSVFVHDAAGNFHDVNRHASESLGYTQEELRQKHLGDIDPEFSSASKQVLLRQVRCGQPVTFYAYYRRKDGTSFPVEVRLGLFEFEGEQLFLGIARDITARRQAELQIREQGNLLDQAHDAIVVSDLARYIIYWNKGAERLLGWTASEAIGQSMDRFMAPPAFTGFGGSWQAALAEDDWRGETSVRDKQGRELMLETHITLVRDDMGRPKSRLSISSDVTEKNQLKDQFFRAQRLESLGMLAAGIAHDLNNVMAPMHMIPPMLRERTTDPRDVRMLDILEKSAERGAALVRQILGFAQGSASERAPLPVKHLLADLKDFIGQTFPKSIDLELSEQPDLWPALASSTQIHQVLLNLCINARDAMPDGGVLRLSAKNVLLDGLAAQAIEGSRTAHWLVFEVEDTGTGIPPEVVDRLWEPFFTTKAPGKGTGLGLSTVRGIVQSHGGFVTLDTRIGRGTVFKIYLPASPKAAESSGELAETSVPKGNGELIFVVDDEPGLRDVTMSALVCNGYRAYSAPNGIEAVAQFAPRGAETRVVVTDIDMPGLNGVAVVNILRRLNPSLKILAVSGLAATASAFDGGSDLADAFLAKPFKTETLLATVHRLLRSANECASPARCAGHACAS